MFQCPIDKHIKLAQTCSPLRLSKANMDEYAKQAALVVSLVDEVEAVVPIHDDTLQAMCVCGPTSRTARKCIWIFALCWPRGRMGSPP